MFLDDADTNLSEQFLKEGFLIAPAANMQALNAIRDKIVVAAAGAIGQEKPIDPEDWLNNIHNLVEPAKLNDFRLAVISAMNSDADIRRNYFEVAKPTLEALVGNELAMQMRVNLSIQMPDDNSSLLPVHSDIWAGDSPYEVVVWIPLVNCYKTKAMFLLPPAANANLMADFASRSGNSSEDLFQSIADEVDWLDIEFGNVLIFNQGLPHGNRVNVEPETRWSLNCRFKGLYTPYGDKKIGEFFEPITMRAASKMGMDYQFPKTS